MRNYIKSHFFVHMKYFTLLLWKNIKYNKENYLWFLIKGNNLYGTERNGHGTACTVFYMSTIFLIAVHTNKITFSNMSGHQVYRLLSQKHLRIHTMKGIPKDHFTYAFLWTQLHGLLIALVNFHENFKNMTRYHLCYIIWLNFSKFLISLETMADQTSTLTFIGQCF